MIQYLQIQQPASVVRHCPLVEHLKHPGYSTGSLIGKEIGFSCMEITDFCMSSFMVTSQLPIVLVVVVQQQPC